MIIRKDAVLAAVAGLLASAGFAMADSHALTLDSTSAPAPAPEVAPAAAPTPEDGLLMQGLDKVGAGDTLKKYGINIYGFIEGGYTWSHRHNTNNVRGVILPGPFNHEYGNHFMLNQLDLRIEKQVDGSKWDVGGMIEVMYGSDAARIHSTGMGFNGSDPTDNNRPFDPIAVANLHPIWQFDVTQAYVDIGVPVGNGLVVRVGKFVTLLSYETIDPRSNAFYSHSYLFSMVPFTQTGILGMYKFNDKLSVTAGITRGWDKTLEDGGSSDSVCAIDFLGQVSYKFTDTITALVNLSVGPQNDGDSSHYRTAIDPIVTWQATDKLSFAAEVLYVYDGGRNGSGSTTHAYGDTWGAAVYATYKINDMFSVSARAEKAHFDVNSVTGLNVASSVVDSESSQLAAAPNFGRFAQTNFYALTLGTTITPFPKDPIGKNLSIRPEIRYDYCEDHVFGNGAGHNFKDQLTFGADVIFKF